MGKLLYSTKYKKKYRLIQNMGRKCQVFRREKKRVDQSRGNYIICLSGLFVIVYSNKPIWREKVPRQSFKPTIVTVDS